MVGFNRRFAPLLVEMRSRFGQPAAGSVTRYLVNAGRLDADSWYRNEELEGSRFTGEGGHFIDTAELVGGQPARGGLRGPRPGTGRRAGHRAVPERLGRHHHLRHRRQLPATRRRRSTCAGGGRSARLDNFQQATVWAGRRRATMRSRGGQDKGQRPELEQFVEACRTGAPMPISFESLVATTARDDRGGEQPGQRPPGAGVTRVRTTSRLGWYARRASQMSPAEVAWRARDQALRIAWSRRQVQPRPARRDGRPRPCHGGGRAPVHRRRCRPIPPRGCPRKPGRPSWRPRTGCCGANGRCWASPGPTWSARLVPRPGDRPPGSRRPLRLPDQPPLRGADRQRQAGLGNLPAAAPDAAGHGLVPQRRRAPTRGGWPTSCARGGGRTRSCPACTGRAASRSASG